MPYTCVWVADPDSIDGPLPVGACYPRAIGALSKRYLELDAARRPPISVIIPTRDGGFTNLCLDAHPTGKPDGHWEVTLDGELVDGQQPILTVTPSLNAVGLYHGWLTAGVLSDDLG